MSEKKVKIGARVIRALFAGSTIGIVGGLGLYLLTVAVNTIADSTVLNPIGMLLIGLGGSLVAAIGIELSKDIEQ